MRKIFFCSLFFSLLYSCKKDSNILKFNTPILSDYIKSVKNQFALTQQLIACAASTDIADPEQITFPLSVFYLPVNGAYDFKYFEMNSNGIDHNNYENYTFKNLKNVPEFNGYLGRFKGKVEKDTWCVVTYKTPGKLHICNPIKIKHFSQPTLFASQVISVQNNGTQPKFIWIDSSSINNSIYFQVVSDASNNLISGTYTHDKHWSFYNLSNVVLNIRNVIPIPSLKNATKYNFTLMGVSVDNWVNLAGQREFITP